VSGERCETCRFWHDDGRATDDSWDRGQCRRSSPTLVEAHFMPLLADGWEKDMERREAMSGLWPLTHDDDFCGEWQPKRPEAA
jgi:hypothetical protein